jgi:hypothetical protein
MSAASKPRRRWARIVAVVLGLLVAYVVAHALLIETGREVIVLRTEQADGSWIETRLWIVDDGDVSWLHGNPGTRWMDNLAARPIVEIERAGATQRWRATQIPGPHPRVHDLLRAKYGIADWWVRTIGADTEKTAPVRLEPLTE